MADTTVNVEATHPDEPLVAWRLGRVEKTLEYKADRHEVAQIRSELALKADSSEVTSIREDIKDFRDATRLWAQLFVGGGMAATATIVAAFIAIHAHVL